MNRSLEELARDALDTDDPFVIIPRWQSLARALIAAEELAFALRTERARHRQHNNLITSGVEVGRAIEMSSRGAWTEAQQETDAALTAYREATGDQS